MSTDTTTKNSFVPVQSLQVRGKAHRDADGTYYNAIGLESTETMRHVSKVWQEKCIPLSQFSADIHDQQLNKVDRTMDAKELRLTDDLKLSDGTGFTMSGLKSMPRNAMKQGVVEYLGEDLGKYENLSDSVNTRAKSDLAFYLNLELDHLGNQRDNTLQARLDKKRNQLQNDSPVPSVAKRLNLEISELETRIQDSQKFFVRTRNDDNGEKVIRYIASERYGKIDNADVMNIIGSALPGGWGDSLASHAWNDGDSMLGNVLVPDYIKARPDSDYGIGFSFKNSEIGRFRFEICPFLFRAICLNGCIWSRSNAVITVDKKHLGTIDLVKIGDEVREAIRIALNEGEQVLELFDTAKEITVEDQTRLIASLSKEYKLTIPAGRAWLKGMESEPGETVFHTIQGLTKAAQDFVGDARQTMEETAGMILAPSLTADIDAIAGMWSKFATRAESLTDDQLKAYVTAK